MPTKINPLSADDLREVQDAIATVTVQDVHLGRALNLITASLARLNNVEYPVPAPEPPAEAPAPEAPAPEAGA
jgi:hypothetical protein